MGKFFPAGRKYWGLGEIETRVVSDEYRWSRDRQQGGKRPGNEKMGGEKTGSKNCSWTEEEGKENTEGARGSCERSA